MADVYPRPRQKKTLPIKLLIAEVAFLVVLSLPIIVALNYFHIINLPFLPQKPTVSDEKKNQIKAYQEQPVLYACPLEPDKCILGKQLFDIKARKLSGFAYEKLEANTKILAAFDGTYEVTKSVDKDKTITTIVLTDTQKENVVTYKFQGNARNNSLTGTIKQKELIGAAGGGTSALAGFNTAQYSLYVKVSNNITKQDLPLKPSEDGKGLRL